MGAAPDTPSDTTAAPDTQDVYSYIYNLYNNNIAFNIGDNNLNIVVENNESKIDNDEPKFIQEYTGNITYEYSNFNYIFKNENASLVIDVDYNFVIFAGTRIDNSAEKINEEINNNYIINIDNINSVINFSHENDDNINTDIQTDTITPEILFLAVFNSAPIGSGPYYSFLFCNPAERQSNFEDIYDSIKYIFILNKTPIPT